jgi:hypothetical protein
MTLPTNHHDDECQLMAIAHTGELKIAVHVDLDRLNMFAV